MFLNRDPENYEAMLRSILQNPRVSKLKSEANGLTKADMRMTHNHQKALVVKIMAYFDCTIKLLHFSRKTARIGSFQYLIQEKLQE